MARLDLAAAPPVALPRSFLMTVPLWGAVAGGLVAFEGGTIFLIRWGGPTLALVHAVTLGVLGNAMVGALFQFLPAAAGVRPWRAVACGRSVHALLNAGAASLVVGFHAFRPVWLGIGAVLLGVAFALTGACMLAPLVRVRGERVLHAGIGIALVALLVTAGLGIAMVGGLTGRWPGLAPVRWADLHAGWGLVGWGLGLLAAVGQTVVPMFHGAAAMRLRVYTAWLVACGLALLGSGARMEVLRLALAVCTAAWAGSTLLRLWRARRFRRNPTLVLGWCVGCASLGAVALALVLDAPAPVVGALALGLAMPMLVLPMLLEITAFLAWLGLQRAVPRRRGMPGIDALQPERTKACVMALMGGTGLALTTAAIWPLDVVARSAGALAITAYAALAIAQAGVIRHERRVLARCSA